MSVLGNYERPHHWGKPRPTKHGLPPAGVPAEWLCSVKRRSSDRITRGRSGQLPTATAEAPKNRDATSRLPQPILPIATMSVTSVSHNRNTDSLCLSVLCFKRSAPSWDVAFPIGAWPSPLSPISPMAWLAILARNASRAAASELGGLPGAGRWPEVPRRVSSAAIGGLGIGVRGRDCAGGAARGQSALRWSRLKRRFRGC